MAPTSSTTLDKQMQCSGFLSWEDSDSSGAFNGTCYGVAAPLRGAYVDLVEHAKQRPAPGPNTTVESLGCLGRAVLQYEVDPTTGTIPAPACLGVEFVRHRQAMVQSMHHHQHQQQQQHIPHDVDLIHADAQASSSISDSTNSSSAEAYMRHAASSTSAHPSTSSAPVFEGPEPAQDPEYHGRPSILQRLQDIHAEASERLEGQDPLWFGKAFAARAALNWESMKNMAGQVLESAKADLGIQTKSEEPK